MSETAGRFHATLAETLARLSDDSDSRVVEVLRHGSLLAEIYAPRDADPQQPHACDEVYVVARGRGWFVNGENRHQFAPGDFLFVPAGVSHRFEDFSGDLAVWVIFYGPVGGEVGNPAADG